MNIVLASSSPRRKSILSKLNIPFIVDFENITEPDYDKSLLPHKYCEQLSTIKALSVSKKYTDTLVIGADTIVLLGEEVLGKPSNKKNAYMTLKSLSGNSHEVITGVTIIYNNIIHVFHDKTIVKFFNIMDSDIETYINSNEPYDKAGSYGIQDYSAIFVEKINGCYDNVVGFPLAKFYNELRKINLEL